MSASSGTPAGVGLQHRRVQVRGRRPGRGQHRHRPPGRLGQPERQEGRRPLVDAHVQPQPAGPLGGGQRQGDRRRPGARREDGVGDPAADAARRPARGRTRWRGSRGGHRGEPGAPARLGHRVGGRRRRAGRARGAAPAARRRPAAAACCETSSVNSATVARPQANGSSGSAAASATPAAMPTEVSSAEETTHGRPCASATRSAARTPPSGCTLRTTTSHGLAQVDPQRVRGPPHHLVGGDPDVDPAAQRGQLLERRARLLDVLQPDAVELGDPGGRGVDVPGGVGVDPDRAGGPQRVAHRLDPGEVVGGASAPARPPSPSPSGSRRPRRSRAPARRPTAGTVTLTGTDVRTGSGQPSTALSTAAAHQRRLSATS